MSLPCGEGMGIIFDFKHTNFFINAVVCVGLEKKLPISALASRLRTVALHILSQSAVLINDHVSLSGSLRSHRAVVILKLKLAARLGGLAVRIVRAETS